MSSGTHIPQDFRISMMDLCPPVSTTRVPRQRVLVKKLVVFVRRVIGAITWTVPLAFLIQFGISGGMLRQYGFDLIGVGRFIRAVVEPGVDAGNAFFATSLVYKGWDFMLLVIGVVTLIVRYHMMQPLHRLESWAKNRCKPIRKKPIPPGMRVVTTENQLGRK